MKRALLIFVLTATSLCTVYGQSDYLDKGNTLLNNGDFEGAEKIFRDGIKADSNDLILQCQLGLTLIQMKKYDDAESILNKVLEKEPNHVGGNWYAGVGNYKNAKDRKAIEHFETVLPLLTKSSGQYFSANWFIGKSYSHLLRTEGLTYNETDRMLECFEEYLRLQSNAKDSNEIREYVDRKKKRRPSANVEKWIDL
ncbi:MAG: tetratricopeptide repeat protein [Chryseolinea sp.]